MPSPVGSPRQTLAYAQHEISRLPLTALVASSSVHETLPEGVTDQPMFCNAVTVVSTLLSPHALLAQLLDLERRCGRDRSSPGQRRWGPRTLDLDLILMDDLVLDDAVGQHEPPLTLPHPRMHERRFVLAPLVEIWPDAIVPGPHANGRTAAQLLAALR